MQHESQDDSSLTPLDVDELEAKVDNILSTMCFVIADPAESVDDPIGGEEMPSAWLRFESDTEQGTVRLTATNGFLEEAASGLLGMDVGETIGQSDMLDALTELTNVVGGEVVALLGGEEISFQMGIPTTTHADIANATAPSSSRARVSFDSMGETLHVEVAYDRI